MSDYQLPDSAAYPLPAPADQPDAGAALPGAKITRGEAVTIKRRLRAAERYYEQAFRDHYQRCLEIYRGEHWPRQAKGGTVGPQRRRHRPVVNVLRHAVETKVASIAFNYPEFILKPRNPEGEANEDTARRALAYEYGEAKAQAELKRAWRDREIADVAILITGWEFRTEEGARRVDGRDPVQGEPPDPETVQAALLSGNPLPPPEPEPKVLRDQFYCRRLNPSHFRISPEAGRNWENAPWCGHIEFVPLEEVKANPRYRNTKNLKGSAKFLLDFMDKDDLKKKQQDAEPPDLMRVELWHYYEKERELHVVFAKEQEQPLLVERWQSKQGRYPYRIDLAPGAEDDFYPNPPRLIQWFGIQQEINETRADMHIHRSRFKRKYQCAKDMLDAAGEKALNSSEDGAVIYHKGPPGSQQVIPVADAQLSGDLWNVARQAMQDLSLLTGLDQYQLAQPPTKRLTEGEVQAIQSQGGAIKEADAQAFEALCAAVAQDCLEWLQQFPDRARKIPIYDPNDQLLEWRPYTAKEIQGEYQFQVYVGSTLIKDRIGSIKEMAFLLQTLAPFIQMGLADGRELLRQVLASNPDIKDVNAIVNTAPPPAPPGMEGAAPGGPAGPGAPNPLEMLAMQGGGAPPPMAPGGPGGF